MACRGENLSVHLMIYNADMEMRAWEVPLLKVELIRQAEGNYNC